MSSYEVITIILATLTLILAIISIIIAIYSSRQTSKEAYKQIETIKDSTTAEIETLKSIILHQEKIAWSILQHHYMTNMFELSKDKNQLSIIQQELKTIGNDSNHINELKRKELSLSYQIKNREISNNNYERLLKHLRQSTEDRLSELHSPK